tara:strand:+ start:1482 stop:2540 length:1059 start_codon:yes stop_codon:yes gene_type:complete
MDIIYKILLFVSAPMIITWFLLDVVRKISIKFRVFAVPNERSSHSKIVPATGGVALLISWLLIILMNVVFNDYHLGNDLYFYALAGIIMSIVGFYDDLKEIPSILKLFMQVFVFFIISFSDNIMINSLHGLFGIYEIGYYESIAFSLFVFIVIINSMNLIDGIDGLSASLSLFFLIITAYFYYLTENEYVILIISFSSTLVVFLTFNYSLKRKIFLGDTGSLGLGLCISCLALGWLNTEHPSFGIFPINPSLFVVLILAYPLLDVIRVFTIRIYNKKSFMSPDRNHIHHKLIDIGFSHKLAVLLILLTQIIILLFNSYVINEMNLHVQIIINAIIITMILIVLYRIPNKSIS